MSWDGKERRLIEMGFGLACVRPEGGWNYDITRGGIERRKDHPNYEGFVSYPIGTINSPEIQAALLRSFEKVTK